MSIVTGYSLLGLSAVPVVVEVDFLPRLPQMTIVGLPASRVREVADTVRSAIVASGYEFPRVRVVVSVAPADLRKDAAGLALPIAVAILAESRQIAPISADRVHFGDLSLSGAVRPVRGALAVLGALPGGSTLVVAPDSAADGIVRPDVSVVALANLADLRHAATPGPVPPPAAGSSSGVSSAPSSVDCSDIRGNLAAIPLLVGAARERRPVVLRGPAGCGKTMIAARLPDLLPPPTTAEATEIATIQDVAGLRAPGTPIGNRRPFRAPHHTVSLAGLLGGATLRPGEVSLAHGGVLFLDEYQEFTRSTREALSGIGDSYSAHFGGAVLRYPASSWVVVSLPAGASVPDDALLRDAVVIDVDQVPRAMLLSDDPATRWPSTAELRARVSA